MLLSRAKLRDVLMKFMTLGYVSFVFSAILDASRFITIVEPGPLPTVAEKIGGIKELCSTSTILSRYLVFFVVSWNL